MLTTGQLLPPHYGLRYYTEVECWCWGNVLLRDWRLAEPKWSQSRIRIAPSLWSTLVPQPRSIHPPTRTDTNGEGLLRADHHSTVLTPTHSRSASGRAITHSPRAASNVEGVALVRSLQSPLLHFVLSFALVAATGSRVA